MLLRQERLSHADVRSAMGIAAASIAQFGLFPLERGEQGADSLALVPRRGAHVHVLLVARGTGGRLRDVPFREATIAGLHRLSITGSGDGVRRSALCHVRRCRVHVQRQR